MSNTETSSFQFVVGRRNGAGAAEVGDDGAGPEGGDFAGNLILIPTVAAAGLPDGAGHAAVNFLDEGLLNFRTDFQDALLPAFHQLHAINGVTNLGFDHENDGIVAQSGVGAEKHEEIREASDSYAEIGGHPFAPGIVNFYAALPHQAAPNERLGGAETGAVNQDVNRTLDTIARDDAVLADFGDAFSDEFDVRTIKSGVVIVGNEDAFAAQLIVRSERGAQFGILDPAGEQAKSNILRFLSNGFIAKKAENAKLLSPENKLAQGPARNGDASKAALPFLTEGEIEARHNPRRRALEEMELADAWRDLRHELDRAGTGADNGDILAIQVHAVIPRRGMKRGTFETVKAL